MITHLWLIPLFVCSLVSTATAQTPLQLSRSERDSFSKRIGGASGAAKSLQGTDGKTTSVQRDAIADSLVGLVIAPGRDEVPAILRLSAISLLGEAGMAPAPKRYNGSAARLNQIVYSSSDPGIQAAATTQLAALPSTSGAVGYLAKIASSPRAAASVAVTVLATTTSAEGQQALRQLFIQKTITEETAQVELMYWALKLGWIAKPSPRRN